MEGQDEREGGGGDGAEMAWMSRGWGWGRGVQTGGPLYFHTLFQINYLVRDQSKIFSSSQKAKKSSSERFNEISICLGYYVGALFTGVMKSITVQGVLVQINRALPCGGKITFRIYCNIVNPEPFTIITLLYKLTRRILIYVIWNI